MSEDGDPTAGTLRLPTETPATDRLTPVFVETLYEAHGRELLAFLIGVLRDVNAAQDVSQITFRRVLEVGHTAGDETIKGWIFKLALREALVYRREIARQNRQLEKYSQQSNGFSSADAAVNALVNHEDVSRLKKLLIKLPVDQQYVVRQRIYEDKTFAIIAEELNVPLGTVLTRMRLALEKVRKWFGNE